MGQEETIGKLYSEIEKRLFEPDHPKDTIPESIGKECDAWAVRAIHHRMISYIPPDPAINTQLTNYYPAVP